MTEAVVREARARIAEIDQQLGEWRRLNEERERLQQLLDWYGTNRVQVPLFKNGVGQVIQMTPPDRAAMADKRFHPRSNSNTTRIVGLARKLLEARPSGMIPFGELVEMVPREIAGNGEHWRESIRTAIKRAGGRFGIAYENGAIRIVNRNPQAFTA